MITEMYLFASGFVGTVYAAAEKNTGLVFPLKREVPVSGCLHVISPIYFSGQKTIVVVMELLESQVRPLHPMTMPRVGAASGTAAECEIKRSKVSVMRCC